MPSNLLPYDLEIVFCLSQFWFVFVGQRNVITESPQVIHSNKLFDPVILKVYKVVPYGCVPEELLQKIQSKKGTNYFIYVFIFLVYQYC